ncbi:MAG: triose-phosphate isomerase [Candidatus Coatesbacteria bacterium]|nr:MAG: triose-phosphate isomerase [Candidatus Coatesbacteria bacterium]
MANERRPLIAGNWKMHKTIKESVELVDGIIGSLAKQPVEGVDVLVCPAFTALERVSKRLSGTDIALGGQNCSHLREGARTGEISPLMLLDAGCTFVILGHSERRSYFHETNEMIGAKVKLALECGLRPVLCVGEALEQREQGRTFDVLRTQIEGCLTGLAAEQLAKVTVAYEPIWAIGTGRTATPETAQEAHRFIRGLIASLSMAQVANGTRILYGGSVKPENAASLLAQPDIDGALVGGASLKADAFYAIITSAR